MLSATPSEHYRPTSPASLCACWMRKRRMRRNIPMKLQPGYFLVDLMHGYQFTWMLYLFSILRISWRKAPTHHNDSCTQFLCLNTLRAGLRYVVIQRYSLMLLYPTQSIEDHLKLCLSSQSYSLTDEPKDTCLPPPLYLNSEIYITALSCRCGSRNPDKGDKVSEICSLVRLLHWLSWHVECSYMSLIMMIAGQRKVSFKDWLLWHSCSM